MDGLACPSSTQATRGKGSKRLDRRLRVIRESAQHCSGPSRHPSGRLPRSAPRRCHGLVSGHLGPGQNFAADKLEPIRCNFSSARKVVAVKRASPHICRPPPVQHQDLASPLTHDDFEVCRRCDTERDTERPRWGAGAVDEANRTNPGGLPYRAADKIPPESQRLTSPCSSRRRPDRLTAHRRRQIWRWSCWTK